LLISVGKPHIDISKKVRRRGYFTTRMREILQILIGDIWKSIVITILGMLYAYFLVLTSSPASNLHCVRAIFVPSSKTDSPSKWLNRSYICLSGKMKSLNVTTERALDRWVVGIRHYLETSHETSQAGRQAQQATIVTPRRVKKQVTTTSTTELVKKPKRSPSHRVQICRNAITQHRNRRCTCAREYQNTSTIGVIASKFYNNLSAYGQMYAMSTTSDRIEGDHATNLPSSAAKVLLFETDSYEVKVDSGCSYSMSGAECDFVPGTIEPVRAGMSVGTY
jgi:hypothetical protein